MVNLFGKTSSPMKLGKGRDLIFEQGRLSNKDKNQTKSNNYKKSTNQINKC
jgi:hypothetical protein